MSRTPGTMSKLVSTAGIVAGLGLVAFTVVQPVVAAPPTLKVGFIDLEQTLYETPVGKRASEAFDRMQMNWHLSQALRLQQSF